MLDGVDLELHPILSATDGGFQLIFNIVTGEFRSAVPLV